MSIPMNELSQLLDTKRFIIANEAAMQSFGTKLVNALPKKALVTLSGELGAGKSVLARAMIHSLGYEGRVKSPTYTLIET
ncbi:MAG: tRNA threonylcarbamoyladenosine biosynthesis protein TsaE, partial [Granulosicoccus sp.]